MVSCCAGDGVPVPRERRSTVDVDRLRAGCGGPDLGRSGEAAAVLDAYPAESSPGECLRAMGPPASASAVASCGRQLLGQSGAWEDCSSSDPADEEAQLALMQPHVDAGDRSAALRQFERMDRALRAGNWRWPAGPAGAKLRGGALHSEVMRGLVTVARERDPN